MQIVLLEKLPDMTYSDISHILQESHSKAKSDSGIEMSTNGVTPFQIQEKVEKNNGKVFVAMEDGVPVATVTLLQRHINTWYAKGVVGKTCFIATLPTYQRRGYSAELINRATEHARQNGFVAMNVVLAANNIPSLRLQQKLGYVAHTFCKYPNLNHFSIQMVKYLEEPQVSLVMLKFHFLLSKFLTIFLK